MLAYFQRGITIAAIMKRLPGKRGPQYAYLTSSFFAEKHIRRIQPAKGRLQNSLNEFRIEHGLTQAALAKLSGVSRTTINGIETGKRDPSTSVVLALAKALGRPVEQIFKLY